jgi:glyoxylase-like metal-dependent hydrolase (beta-lactamase superfamily II)
VSIGTPSMVVPVRSFIEYFRAGSLLRIGGGLVVVVVATPGLRRRSLSLSIRSLFVIDVVLHRRRVAHHRAYTLHVLLIVVLIRRPE